MNSPTQRTPRMRLVTDDRSQLQPWRVRTTDGLLRGPVGLEGLQSLLEVGLINRAAVISCAETEHWIPIGKHPIWPQLQPSVKKLSLRRSEWMEDLNPTASPAPDVPLSRATLDRLAALRNRDLQRSFRHISWWQAAKVLRATREILIFFCFLTASDLLTSFFATSVGLVKWAVLLGLAGVAVMYYSFRTTDR